LEGQRGTLAGLLFAKEHTAYQWTLKKISVHGRHGSLANNARSAAYGSPEMITPDRAVPTRCLLFSGDISDTHRLPSLHRGLQEDSSNSFPGYGPNPSSIDDSVTERRHYFDDNEGVAIIKTAQLIGYIAFAGSFLGIGSS
jgi:hypothetical protein